MNIKRSGAQPSAKGSAEYFTGTVQGVRSQKGLFAAHTESTGRK
ncbi:hypothetical protein [Microcoleus sp. FACHB-68]|nr:hypothetical protein [Microcoleus sp. FACHB-68]